MVMIKSKTKTILLATFAFVATTSLIASGGAAIPAFAHSDDNDHRSDHNHENHDNNHGHNNNVRNFDICVRDHGGKSISKNELNRCENR